MMNIKRILRAGEILRFISDEELTFLSQIIHVDKWVKKLTGRLIFTLLVYSVLRYKIISTRILELTFNSPGFKAFFPHNEKARHSSIADRLRTINPDYFVAIFNILRSKLSSICEKKAVKTILRVDSTIVRIGAGLVKWGFHVGSKPHKGYGYKQLKLTVSLHEHIPINAKIYTDKKYLSEDMALGEVLLTASKESILVFDRGARSRSLFEQLCDQNSSFVTRANEQIVFKHA